MARPKSTHDEQAQVGNRRNSAADRGRGAAGGGDRLHYAEIADRIGIHLRTVHPHRPPPRGLYRRLTVNRRRFVILRTSRPTGWSGAADVRLGLLPIDQPVVFGVRADPEPNQVSPGIHRQSAIV